MKRLRLYGKVMGLFLARKTVKREDIGNSYDRVSKKYEKTFLQVMHSYNDELLEQALQLFEPAQELSILDLACGTGYNISYLRENCQNCHFDAVDISKGMLEEIPESPDATCYQSDMLVFLRECDNNKYDMIVCGWAIKYQKPKEIMKQCFRVLKKCGVLAVIVNTKQTLPEVRRVYPKLLKENVQRINKLMLELPNPKTEQQLNLWAQKNSFCTKVSKSLSHIFAFESPISAVDFVTSTGALAGFDIMIDLQEREIKKQLVALLEQTNTITHNFVYGIYTKGF